MPGLMLSSEPYCKTLHAELNSSFCVSSQIKVEQCFTSLRILYTEELVISVMSCVEENRGPLGILFLLVLLILSLQAPSGSYSCFNLLPLIILSSPIFLLLNSKPSPSRTERTLSDGPFTLP